MGWSSQRFGPCCLIHRRSPPLDLVVPVQLRREPSSMGLVSRAISSLQSSDLRADSDVNNSDHSYATFSTGRFATKRAQDGHEVRRRARPISPPRVNGYLRLITTPTTGLFRAARRTRCRAYLALDGLSGELTASHTPRHSPLWTIRIVHARLVSHDSDLRLDIDTASSTTRRSTCSLIAESKADYFRWKNALEIAVTVGWALREGGAADLQFRRVYDLRGTVTPSRSQSRAAYGAGPLLTPCLHKTNGEQCIASKVMSTRVDDVVWALRRQCNSTLVPLRDLFVVDEAAIEVAPAYPLGTLSDLFDRHPQSLPMRLVVQFCKDIFSSLRTLHEAGLVHRAITAHSIFISSENLSEIRDHSSGRLKFSSATNLRYWLGRFENTCYESDIQPEFPSAGAGEVSPTSAPEFLLCEQYGAPADMWSVGALLYRMLTGKPPFKTQSELELIRAIETADYDFSPAQRYSIPADAVHLVDSLLMRIPTTRLTAAQALNHSLVRRQVKQVAATVDVNRATPSMSSLSRRPRPLSRSVANGSDASAGGDDFMSSCREDVDGRSDERGRQNSAVPHPFTGLRRTHGSLDCHKRDVDHGSAQRHTRATAEDKGSVHRGERPKFPQLTLPPSLTASSGDFSAAFLARQEYESASPSPGVALDCCCEFSGSQHNLCTDSCSVPHLHSCRCSVSRMSEQDDVHGESSAWCSSRCFHDVTQSGRGGEDSPWDQSGFPEAYGRFFSDLGATVHTGTAWKECDESSYEFFSGLETSDCTGSPFSGHSPSLERDRDCSDRYLNRPRGTKGVQF